MQGEEQSHQPGLTPAERELEDALRGLRPSPTQIRRDRLHFNAGAASSGGHRWPRAVGLVAAGLALGVGLSVFWPSDSRVVKHASHRDAPPTKPVRIAQKTVKKELALTHSEIVAIRPTSQQVAEATPAELQPLEPVPIPFPTSPLFTVPPRFVKVSRVQFASDVRSSAYFTAIQNVLERSLEAIPSTRTAPADTPSTHQSAPSLDAPSVPATDVLEPS